MGDERATAAADVQGEDWRGRALCAEARVAELEGFLRVIRVVVGEFTDRHDG